MNVIRPLLLPVIKGNQIDTDFASQKEGAITLYGWSILSGSFIMEKGKLKTTSASSNIAQLVGINGKNFIGSFKSTTNSQYTSVLCRIQDINNFYMLRHNIQGGVVEIVRNLAGAFTTLASIVSPNDGQKTEFSCIGSKLTVRKLAKEISVIDTTFTSGGFGIRGAVANDSWEWLKAVYYS